MEASVTSSTEGHRSPVRRYGVQFSTANLIQAPLSALIEYSGILRGRQGRQEAEFHVPSSIASGGATASGFRERTNDPAGPGAEVSIRIIGVGEQDNGGVLATEEEAGIGGEVAQMTATGGGAVGEVVRPSSPMAGTRGMGSSGGQAESGAGAASSGGGSGRDSSYQRYDIQQLARWIEQILPFTLLLLVVFIRQHLQGFFVTFWIAAVMIKSNDILRKQTALKGERKISVLIGISLVFILHITGVYWWYRNSDLLYPLLMLPPKSIPPFWHAIFIIVVNDTMARQAAMVVKCMILVSYKNSRGRDYRKQGQMLTLVEYTLLLYRALLPTPVWYRFFLNKDYGSLFSSLTTGLYLTFKLTSIVEKVQSFFAALKALSRKEVHYGSYGTAEQVNATGDLCAICQEKMHAPILLRCKHIFCEDCVSEWFERERTCPLCRALVKPPDLKSFGDGSASLFFQLF